MIHSIVTKFMLRPRTLPFIFLSPPRFFPKPSSFAKPLSLSLLSNAASTITATLDDAFSYGPSLHKGQKPFQHPLPRLPIAAPPTDNELPDDDDEEEDDDNDDDNSIDVDSFTRAFEIAALRVPSEQCFDLESRLRGHLLNWPRIRNIARVPGDEVEEEFKEFLKNQNDTDFNDDDASLVSLNRRIYGKAGGDGESLGPVLYRDKLARTFNSKGFVKFRNLAKLSRPRKKKKKVEGKEKEKGQNKGMGKNDFAVVEVIEEERGDLSGLLGDEFKGRRWKGSTRLLLLDESYAGKGLDQMPEAIKVSLQTLF